jgi:hypothetical protein
MARRWPPAAEIGTAVLFIAAMAGLGWTVERLPRPGASEARARFLEDRARCHAGEVVACANLGVRHATGLGTERDETTAAAYYLLACTRGHALACSNLGALYATGRGVAADPGRAIELFRHACRAGEPAACDNLDRMGAPR